MCKHGCVRHLGVGVVSGLAFFICACNAVLAADTEFALRCCAKLLAVHLLRADCWLVGQSGKHCLFFPRDNEVVVGLDNGLVRADDTRGAALRVAEAGAVA